MSTDNYILIAHNLSLFFSAYKITLHSLCNFPPLVRFIEAELRVLCIYHDAKVGSLPRYRAYI